MKRSIAEVIVIPDSPPMPAAAAEASSSASSSSLPILSASASQKRKEEHDPSPDFGWNLMYISSLKASANENCIQLQQLFEDKRFGRTPIASIVSNYMIDLPWLLGQVPLLAAIPTLLLHGEQGERAAAIKVSALGTKITVHAPRLPVAYGTHHSKLFLIWFNDFLRVVVHTANLIDRDWGGKSQGIWFQDFPPKSPSSPGGVSSEFEDDLTMYLTAVGKVSLDRVKQYDFSNAKASLICSVPGYHTGPMLHRYGHLRLKAALQKIPLSKEFENSPVYCQCSSIGSLDPKWMHELTSSMAASSNSKGIMHHIPEYRIIWPTVDDVKNSYQGYEAGCSIPFSAKNNKDFLRSHFYRWIGREGSLRDRAMPHIKTYTRISKDNPNLAPWVLLTSSNLSKAAWGSLQKDGTQLMIRSYEVGVLLSSDQGLHLSFTPHNQGVTIPLPFMLPSQPYSASDVPWQWDIPCSGPDIYGNTWDPN